MKELRPALVVFIALTLITGVAYPLLVTAIAQVAFPRQANGSVIEVNGKVVGSALMGQAFDDPGYFWSRPSATNPPCNGASSAGSNLGPTNPELFRLVAQRVEKLRAAHPDQKGLVPVDLVTASGSGLDPHISPAAAEYQIGRVAMARGLPKEQVRQLVEEHTEGRAFSLLGEPRVNVLLLNLALDRIAATEANQERR